MKLSNVFAKLTCIKTHAVRVLATAAVAGAVFAAAAPAAEAQHFAVGVRIGGPVQVAPAPVYDRGPIPYGAREEFYAPGPVVYGHDFHDRDFRDSRDRDFRDRAFYERRRFEEHEAYLRHQEWLRSHYARPYGYR